MKIGGKRLRTEQKYYLHLHDYQIVKDRVAQLLKLDEHSITEDGYNIRSLYFDDARRTSIETKNDGVFKRNKYRIRIYNGSDRHIALERKHKLGEFVAKESIKLSRIDYDNIMRGDYRTLYARKEQLATDFAACLNAGGYTPSAIVDYWREAYIYSFGNVRITFDKRLAVGSNVLDLFHPELSLAEILPPSKTILEVKFDEMLPSFIQSLVTPVNHQRSSISKYVLCKEMKMFLHTE